MKGKDWIIHLICLFIACSFSFVLRAATTYEAENAKLTPGLAISESISGFSGSGYVGNFSNENDTLSFRFPLTSGGYYDLSIGVAAPYGNKTNYITINGSQSAFTVTSSDSFSEKSIGRVRLTAGENVINITKSWGWFYVDYLKISENTDSPTEFGLPEQPVTPNASENSQRLYTFLKDHLGKNIISGVMTLDSFDESTWLKQQFGKEPALLGLDFMHCNRNYGWYDDYAPVNDAKAWYNKNGIPAICWHWRDPSRLTEEFYTEHTSFDVSKIFDENSPEYQAMIDDIDQIAILLKSLTVEDIPVLWRPLHEASGGWFWWGANGPQACKKLWQIMFDRLVNLHQINNLIWIWTTDTKEDHLEWYPGDEYVDILGVDIYAEQGDLGSQYLTFDQVKNSYGGRKMITLSECGIIPDPDKLITEQAEWSWFMPWYGDFVRDNTYNPRSHWEKVLEHNYVITLDEMPDLRNYVTSVPVNEEAQAGPYFVYIDRSLRQLRITPSESHEKYNAFVYSLSGECIFKMQKASGNQQISLLELKSGFLIVTIQTAQAVYSYKLISDQF